LQGFRAPPDQSSWAELRLSPSIRQQSPALSSNHAVGHCPYEPSVAAWLEGQTVAPEAKELPRRWAQQRRPKLAPPPRIIRATRLFYRPSHKRLNRFIASPEITPLNGRSYPLAPLITSDTTDPRPALPTAIDRAVWFSFVAARAAGIGVGECHRMVSQTRPRPPSPPPRQADLDSMQDHKKNPQLTELRALKLAGWTRLELATFCVTGRRSNQLSYHPVNRERVRNVVLAGGVSSVLW
jgi:hypothetical protein